MPFNMAVASGGARFFLLSIDAEDLAINYNIEAQLISQYGISGTLAGDRIRLNIAGVKLVALSNGTYAIDGNSLHDSAHLEISLTAGAWISGRGGTGGKGGNANGDIGPPFFDLSQDGNNGTAGGTPIRYGCPTDIIGTGTIERGYGGGGGGAGGASSSTISGAGGGGGGGAPFGGSGGGGSDLLNSNDGASGSAAGETTLGAGGAGGSIGGDGGDGAQNGTSAQSGQGSSGQVGGSAGADGSAIHKQGFAHSAAGGITLIGPVV